MCTINTYYCCLCYRTGLRAILAKCSFPTGACADAFVSDLSKVCERHTMVKRVVCLCWSCNSKVGDSSFVPDLTEDDRKRVVEEFPVIVEVKFKSERFITREEDLDMINATLEMVGIEFGISVNKLRRHGLWL
ncbi:hypothetical protein MCOR07_002519 [Pyricularia oryzae]|nr:hypothetical protein MCOR23_002769 [Pyricularia oryzae]KAI6410956.1 hypothetical protein MCOR20_004475 [Pyricularia oryzae]KAI6626250.1 hypothetical protein MCOR07_002519 [Pyricularia oryzae]